MKPKRQTCSASVDEKKKWKVNKEQYPQWGTALHNRFRPINESKELCQWIQLVNVAICLNFSPVLFCQNSMKNPDLICRKKGGEFKIIGINNNC